MPKLGKAAFLPMILSAVLAAAAGAQAAQDCNIDENTTISMSVFALLAAQQPGTRYRYRLHGRLEIKL